MSTMHAETVAPPPAPAPPSRPRLGRRITIIVLALIALGSLIWRSVYVLDDTQYGWLSGGTRGTGLGVVEPGLHIKWPWQSLCRFSRQIHWREIGPAERATAAGGAVMLTATVSWRLAPEGLPRRVQLAQSDAVLGDEIASVVSEGLDREVSQHPLTQFLAELEPTDTGPQDLCLGQAVRAGRAAWIMERYGLELLDVSVVRVSLTPAVHAHLQEAKTAQRQAEANRIAQKAADRDAVIQAKADDDAKLIKTKAETEAAAIRANGKTRAAKLIADARRPELDSLLKAIEGYRAAMDKDTTLVLEGGREFFHLIEEAAKGETTPAAQSHPEPSTQP